MNEELPAKSRIFILMAVYNGSEYIEEQIRSIQLQTMSEWILLIRDDSSTDETVTIVNDFVKQDARIKLIKDNFGSQRLPQKNFALLVENAMQWDFDYVFFADQDDIWEPNKLSVMYDSLVKLSAQYDHAPIMLHTDLTVVDKNNQVIADSFLRYQGLHHPGKRAINTLLVQNFVTGCTSAVNRVLLEKALPFPEKMIMHDWWLALCASILGELFFLSEPLIRYRQHDNNSVGARSYWKNLLWALKNPYKKWTQARLGSKRLMDQARELKRHLESEPHKSVQIIKVLKMLDTFISLERKPFIKKIYFLTSLRLRRQKKLSDILLKLVLLTS
ncbi:glycosyltransferase family 2 protein [Legionella israelensis]|uniref:Glycosyltransferase family 2 protein n=1 Tax=Legionella israelensis TaxID=454 RepID=A0AAX1EH53_9GAMM|nr:glycosyltransferase family 2 protein [Legionella israelensis]QBR84506.1 glycosyltransferase family 2 protein [Legionella israelensis]